MPENIRSFPCGCVQQVTKSKVVLLFCPTRELEVEEVGNG